MERLDARAAPAGLDPCASARVGLGVELGLASRWRLAAETGRSVSHADFGLLVSPGVNLERADTSLELRLQVLSRFGWRVRPAVGVGRLRLAYHPDQLGVDSGGTPLVVALPPLAVWTRYVAAELLHSLGGRNEIALRCGGRFYDLEVATPDGVRRSGRRDLQVGARLRVALF